MRTYAYTNWCTFSAINKIHPSYWDNPMYRDNVHWILQEADLITLLIEA